MNKTTRNRGFSIMETVIALVVIVMVTAAALSITMAAISARVKMSNYSEAQDFAHNVLECFKAADDKEEFEYDVKVVAGYELTPGEPSTYTYSAGNKFTAYINGIFEIKVTEFEKDDKVIISVPEYQKHTKG